MGAHSAKGKSTYQQNGGTAKGGGGAHAESATAARKNTPGDKLLAAQDAKKGKS